MRSPFPGRRGGPRCYADGIMAGASAVSPLVCAFQRGAQAWRMGHRPPLCRGHFNNPHLQYPTCCSQRDGPATHNPPEGRGGDAGLAAGGGGWHAVCWPRAPRCHCKGEMGHVRRASLRLLQGAGGHAWCSMAAASGFDVGLTDGIEGNPLLVGSPEPFSKFKASWKRTVPVNSIAGLPPAAEQRELQLQAMPEAGLATERACPRATGFPMSIPKHSDALQASVHSAEACIVAVVRLDT